MKKLSLIAFLSLMMTVVSFQGIAQEVSTVMVIGDHSSNNFTIRTINKDLEESENKHRNNSEYYLFLKKELDKWIKQGYKIENSTTVSSERKVSFYTIYILIKEE